MSSQGSFPSHDLSATFQFAREEEVVLQCELGCCSSQTCSYAGIVLLIDWRDIDAFQESLRQSKDRKPFSFYVCFALELLQPVYSD